MPLLALLFCVQHELLHVLAAGEEEQKVYHDPTGAVADSRRERTVLEREVIARHDAAEVGNGKEYAVRHNLKCVACNTAALEIHLKISPRLLLTRLPGKAFSRRRLKRVGRGLGVSLYTRNFVGLFVFRRSSRG